MLEKINKYIHVINLVLILLLFCSTLFLWNKYKDQVAKNANYESSIAAISATMTTTVNHGVETVAKPTPEIDLNQLTQSAYFKTLSANQQNFYNSLSEVKGLISATRSDLEKHGQILATLLASQSGGVIKNDTICYKNGSILKFNETDTSKKMQWHATVRLDTTNTFSMLYDYKVNIQTNFERQKDNTILVKYNINDPDLKINQMQNFIIPQLQAKTAIGRWVQKNEKTLRIIGSAALFVGGVYIGAKFIK